MIYLWGVLAAVAAVILEGLYARTPRFLSLWWILLLLQPVIAYSIYRMVQSSTSIVGAVVVFGFATLCLRTGMSLYLGQTISAGTWVAVVLVFLAQIARRF